MLVALAGCSFELRAGGTGGVDADGDGPAIDGEPTIDTPDGIGDVAHVPAAIEDSFAATAAVTIANATITTGGGAPTIDVTLPPGAMLVS